jgi:2'-5' RNA ligase
MQNQHLRIFLGIEVSEEWKFAIHKFIEENKHLNYRWIVKENEHFTLHFIGIKNNVLYHELT